MKDTMKNLLSQLSLQIILDEEHFDGSLNFGAVAFEYQDDTFILDVTDTKGYLGSACSEELQGKYLLNCTFETDVSQLEDLGIFFNGNETNDYSKEVDLSRDIALPAKAFVNLLLQDDGDISQKNINRIVSISLVHCDDDSIDIPVTQNYDF